VRKVRKKICGHPYHLRHLRAIHQSKIINHQSYHEKGNDKIHCTDIVGNSFSHRNQPGRDFMHQHTVTGNSQRQTIP